jgi:hypothetical protein
MYRRVVPGLPVMMALGNALGEAARKQNQRDHSKPAADHNGSTDSVVGTLRPPATPPVTRAA